MIKTTPAIIERITVERYDMEADTVRLEVVPLSKTYNLEFFEKNILTVNVDNLVWWDTQNRDNEILSSKDARNKLSLKAEDPLTENMVFWAVSQDGKYQKIYHATQAARNLAKDLYKTISS